MDPAIVVAETTPQATAEAVTDAAVEVAAIQADRDVAIATVQADAAVAVAETEGEADDEDVRWLKAELAGLRAQCATQGDSLSGLTQLTQAQGQQIAELTGLVSALSAQMTALIPPSPSPAASSEASPDGAAVIEPVALAAEAGDGATPSRPRRRLVPL